MRDYIHIERLYRRFPEVRSATVVWADRTHDRCGRCGVPIPYEICAPPVEPNLHGLAAVDLQHGCGQWNRVYWRALAYDAPAAEVRRAVQEVRAAYHRDQTERITAIRQSLAGQLGDVVEGHAEATGDETTPGVMGPERDRVAWDYAPVSSGGDIIEVTEQEAAPGALSVQRVNEYGTLLMIGWTRQRDGSWLRYTKVDGHFGDHIGDDRNDLRVTRHEMLIEAKGLQEIGWDVVVGAPLLTTMDTSQVAA